jgi:hypothetical protein
MIQLSLEAPMFWRPAVAGALLLSGLGCASTRPASAPAPSSITSARPASLESISGEYTLVAVDGHALPYAPAARGDAAQAAWPVVAGALALHPSGTFRVETTYSTNVSGSGKNTYQFSGTCFGADGGFNMVWDGGGQTALTVRGDTVVLKNEGKLYSYVRR